MESGLHKAVTMPSPMRYISNIFEDNLAGYDKNPFHTETPNTLGDDVNEANPFIPPHQDVPESDEEEYYKQHKSFFVEKDGKILIDNSSSSIVSSKTPNKGKSNLNPFVTNNFNNETPKENKTYTNYNIMTPDAHKKERNINPFALARSQNKMPNNPPLNDHRNLNNDSVVNPFIDDDNNKNQEIEVQPVAHMKSRENSENSFINNKNQENSNNPFVDTKEEINDNPFIITNGNEKENNVNPFVASNESKEDIMKTNSDEGNKSITISDDVSSEHDSDNMSPFEKEVNIHINPFLNQASKNSLKDRKFTQSTDIRIAKQISMSDAYSQSLADSFLYEKNLVLLFLLNII